MTTETFPGGLRADGTPWSIELVGNQLEEAGPTAVFAIAWSGGQVLAIEGERGWDIPGGHVEAGESPVEALARELLEEAAAELLTWRPVAVLWSDYLSEPSHMSVYAVTCTLHSFQPTEEVQDRQWLSGAQFLNRYAGGASTALMARLLDLAADV